MRRVLAVIVVVLLLVGAGCVDLTDDEPTDDIEGADEDSDAEKPADDGTDDNDTDTGGVNESAFFAVTITDLDEFVTEGETVSVDYVIENTGDEHDTQDIQFTVDGELTATETAVTLGDNETFSGTFTYPTGADGVPGVGIEIASENTSAARAVTVNEPAFFAVEITEFDEEVTAGDTVSVDYTIENPGDTERIQDIVFEVDGTVVDTAAGVTIGADRTVSGTFTYETAEHDAPSIDVTVASGPDSDSETVIVNEPTSPDGELELHHIDVGQADATLLVTPDGETILIDTGQWGTTARS